uniref:Very-long-chain aldehyde decarbonylase CER1-like C-terminal domain-containing protein n=1 Tax=Triticum urartu TaxID=4572 RepID=A0A8R7QZM6_TRIUA
MISNKWGQFTSQFPLKKARKDCTCLSNPAMKIPKAMRNVHTSENCLPRRVMSAWHIAAVVHALDGWSLSMSAEMI